MKRTLETSDLYESRVKSINEKIKVAEKAIESHDFETLFTLTMQDSNSLHSVMLDSWPPIIYLNEDSRKIIEKVIDINKEGIICGYTFDAGPNCHVYVEKNNLKQVEKQLNELNLKKIVKTTIGLENPQ